MKAIKILLLIATITPAIACAGTFKIKDYELNMSIESYRFNYLCKQQPSSDWICLDPAPGDTVGGEKMKSTEIVFGKRGTAESIKITFKSESFDEIQKAILLKYKTFKCHSQPVQSRMGVHLKNTICLSSAEGEDVFLVRYDSTIDTSSIFMVTNERRKQNEDEKARNSRDI